VHIFGELDDDGVPGVGAYTLIINTLPQIAAVETHTLLTGGSGQPSGPTTSFAIVIQGDRLDVAMAEQPENYVITWLGPDGIEGGGDDQVIAVGAGLAPDSKAVIYDPSRNNLDATGSGQRLVYPTAVRQTVTLLFGQALPPGNYRIEVSEAVGSTPFNLDELTLLSPRSDFGNHPVVSITDGAIKEGATSNAWVQPISTSFDTASFERGVPFLAEFHDNSAALLDALLSSEDDAMSATQHIIDLIIARFGPALLDGSGRPITSLLAIFLDPVSANLVDPEGRAFSYDLKAEVDSAITNNLRGTFVDVSRNIEVIVISNPRDRYRLEVADVPARARGGAVYFGLTGRTVESFTGALRAGTRAFNLVSPDPSLMSAPAIPRFPAFLVAAALQPSLAQGLHSDMAFPTSSFGANASLSSLLLAAASQPASFLSSIFVMPEYSGSSATPDPSEARQDALDEIFKEWDTFKRVFANKPELEDGDPGAAQLDASPIGHVWHKFLDAVELLFAPNQTPTPRKEQPAASRGAESGAADADQPAPSNNREPVTVNSDRRQSSEPHAIPAGPNDKSPQTRLRSATDAPRAASRTDDLATAPPTTNSNTEDLSDATAA
jgi:hypothetical protein